MPRPAAHAILAELTKPLAYERELRALIKRHARPGRRPWTQTGLELGDWDPRLCAQIAKMLARSVPQGEYRFGVFSARRAVIGGKERTLYRSSISDAAVLAVVARALRSLSESVLSERVYSYRPGRSALHAVRDFPSSCARIATSPSRSRERGCSCSAVTLARYGESIRSTRTPRCGPCSPSYARDRVAESHPIVALTMRRPNRGSRRRRQRRALERGVPPARLQPVTETCTCPRSTAVWAQSRAASMLATATTSYSRMPIPNGLFKRKRAR